MATPRVAVINSHPIQHFAPLWRDVAATGRVDLRVFYVSHRGLKAYADPHFGRELQWDVDLLAGYPSTLLAPETAQRPATFRSVDSPNITKHLSDFSPDVLLLHGYAFAINWRALAWARMHNTRVLTISDSELRHKRSLARLLAKEAVVRAFFSQIDGALTVGDANARYYQRYGLPEHALHYCPMPVDRARFLSAAGDVSSARARVRRALDIPDDAFVFAAAGKFVPWKRYGDVIDAYAGLAPALRERARVLFIGDGPLRDALQTQARALGRGVVFAGFVNQAAMPAHYAASDAIVVSSEVDAKGLTPTEGHIFGLPTIASDHVGCVGPNDVVREGINGWVYPCGDIPALSARMQQLLVEPDTYARFRAAALRSGERQDTRAAAVDFVRAVESVCAAPKTPFSERAMRWFRRSSMPQGQSPAWAAHILDAGARDAVAGTIAASPDFSSGAPRP